MIRRLLALLALPVTLCLAFVGPARAATVTVASWHMDESAGATTMTDSSGNNNNGAISSGVRVGQPGYSGKAYEFPGAGIVTVPSSSSLNPSSSPFSVSLRFRSSTRPSSSVGDYDLVRKGLISTSGGDWKMEILQSGKVYCHFRGSSGSVNATGTSNVVDGKWHRLGCRTSSSGVAVLVGGNVQSKSAKIPGTIANSASLTIGGKNATEDQTTGVLDDVLVTRG
jgi:hypothetical protein